jgi:hypothetical protein
MATGQRSFVSPTGGMSSTLGREYWTSRYVTGSMPAQERRLQMVSRVTLDQTLEVWKISGMIRRMADDLAQVLKNAARLADEAAEALRRGDSEAAHRLQREAESAWWRARRLGQRQAQRPARVRAPSARERAVTALTELSVPSSPKQIAAYAEARTGEQFDVRALASIRRDEYRSWISGSKRDTYLVPGLEGPWFVAGRGRLALSHWPLWQRIVGPLSPRADHLRLCLQLIGQIENAGRKGEMEMRMRNLLAQYASSVPGASEDVWASSQGLDMSRVRAAVVAEQELIETEDENSRKREAERAMRKLSDEQLIWGGSMPQIVAGRSA